MNQAVNIGKTETNKVTFKKIICPFDLEAIFSL